MVRAGPEKLRLFNLRLFSNLARTQFLATIWRRKFDNGLMSSTWSVAGRPDMIAKTGWWPSEK
jgi:hypothetical protein